MKTLWPIPKRRFEFNRLSTGPIDTEGFLSYAETLRLILLTVFHLSPKYSSYVDGKMTHGNKKQKIKKN